MAMKTYTDGRLVQSCPSGREYHKESILPVTDLSLFVFSVLLWLPTPAAGRPADAKDRSLRHLQLPWFLSWETGNTAARLSTAGLVINIGYQKAHGLWDEAFETSFLCHLGGLSWGEEGNVRDHFATTTPIL